VWRSVKLGLLINPTNAGLEPKCVTELNIDKLVFSLLSIVPISDALLNPVRELTNAALFWVSIFTIS
jgi:hypothetical protein